MVGRPFQEALHGWPIGFALGQSRGIAAPPRCGCLIHSDENRHSRRQRPLSQKKISQLRHERGVKIYLRGVCKL
jgi:hypothetical protein